MSDSPNVILPLSVAVERTGMSADELRVTWGCQELRRTFADGSTEVAILIPQYMLPPPLPIPARRGQSAQHAQQAR